MANADSGERDIIGDLGRILAGAGLLALATVNVIAAVKRGPKRDHPQGAQSLEAFMRDHGRGRGPNRRRPPEAGIAVPAIQPRGPLPMQGGAAAPLLFDGD